MTEAWIAVTLAVVIVFGMTVTRVWGAVITNGAPLLAPLLSSLISRDSAASRAAEEPERTAAIDRRLERLDERVEFLERLLETRSASTLDPP